MIHPSPRVRSLLLVMLCACCACTAGAQVTTPPAPVPAFPEAEGFGAFTRGGRGGDVYLVTTTADYGENAAPIPGSLRAAVEAEGPRTVVFRVSGYIDLVRPLVVQHPYLTIAGQTAPGEGVALRRHGLSVEAPQVILRYLRVRPGDVAGVPEDAIDIKASDVIVDHCSVSWATDETLSVSGDATNVTVQWCLIAESLNESIHPKGAHGYGSLLSSSGDVTVHHTIYAFHQSRNPRPKDVLLDFRNNLVYGYGDRAGYNTDDFTRMNYVGNVIRPLAYSNNDRYAFIAGSTNGRFYLADNLLVHDGDTLRDDAQMIRPPAGMPPAEALAALRVATPFAAPAVRTDAAVHLTVRLLDTAGAALPGRDEADRRVLALIEAGEGRILDTQESVGGWPPLAGGTAPPDADRDGLPDAWETRHGLDPAAAHDQAADADADGYTNLEEFLNGTDPNTPYRWLPPPQITPPHGTAFAGDSLRVSLESMAPGAPVHYTLDGIAPTSADPSYHVPFYVHGSTQVRARHVEPDRPTTTAYAAYEHLRWQAALPDTAALHERLRKGVRYARYEADDWDEGPPLDALQPVRTGTTPTLDFALRPGSGRDALVFDGYLKVPKDGIYAFYLTDDARSRLYVNGHLVARGQAAQRPPGQVALRKGLHRLHLRSLHEAPRSASLEWRPPGRSRTPLPGSLLYHLPHSASSHDTE